MSSLSWIGLWRHCWRRRWLRRVHCTDWEWDLCLECPLWFTSYLSYLLNYFIFHVIKGIKNGCPCIVEIRGTLRLCLCYVPALAYGSCRVSDQGTTLRASDLHNARSTILNPFNKVRHLFLMHTVKCNSRQIFSRKRGIFNGRREFATFWTRGHFSGIIPLDLKKNVFACICMFSSGIRIFIWPSDTLTSDMYRIQ